MIFLTSAFSLFLGILSSPGALATFSDEVEAQFTNIEGILQDFLQQVDIKYVALPFLEGFGNTPSLTLTTTEQIDDSLQAIRLLVTEDDPAFPCVIDRLYDILNTYFWRAASNIEDRETVLRTARAHLEFLEARMEALDSTGVMYGMYLLMRCGVIEFMSSLGGANGAWSERSEVLNMLNRDVYVIDDDLIFDQSSFAKGEHLSTSMGCFLFGMNYLWKIRRVGTGAEADFDPSLPSWSAFYSFQGPQRPPTPARRH